MLRIDEQTKRIMYTHIHMCNTHTHTHHYHLNLFPFLLHFVLHSRCILSSFLFFFLWNDLLTVIVYSWLCKVIYNLVVNSWKNSFSFSLGILMANAMVSHTQADDYVKYKCAANTTKNKWHAHTKLNNNNSLFSIMPYAHAHKNIQLFSLFVFNINEKVKLENAKLCD